MRVWGSERATPTGGQGRRVAMPPKSELCGAAAKVGRTRDRGGGAVEGVAALPKVGERKEMNGKGWVKCYVRKS